MTGAKSGEVHALDPATGKEGMGRESRRRQRARGNRVGPGRR